MSPRRLRSYSFVMDIFPVVHINDIAIAVDQATLAIAAGADGVYLIHHGGNWPLLARGRLHRSLNDIEGAGLMAPPQMFSRQFSRRSRWHRQSLRRGNALQDSVRFVEVWETKCLIRHDQ